DYPSGKPRRVTSLEGAEGYPAWSPDGRYLAFVRRVAEDSGGIYRTGGDGTGQLEPLTRGPGLYTGITYSKDGSKINAREQPLRIRGEQEQYGAELIWIPAGGGPSTKVGSRLGTGTPHIGPDPDRIYMDGYEGLVSFRFDGTERRTHLRAHLKP